MHINSFGRVDEVLNNSSLKLTEVITEQAKLEKRVLILLSAGSAVRMYPYLAEFIEKNETLSKDRIIFAQVDERFQPFHGKSKLPASPARLAEASTKRAGRQITNFKNNEQINAYMIAKTELWDVCQDNKIPYYLISQKGTLQEAASEYNQTMEQLFKECDCQIAVLGIGRDGHTGGLIPGYEKVWNTDRYIVGYRLGQNNPRGQSCQQKFYQRITLTPRSFKMIEYALIVATGENKRSAVQRLLRKEINTDLNNFPAAVIRSIKTADLYTDLKI